MVRVTIVAIACLSAVPAYAQAEAEPKAQLFNATALLLETSFSKPLGWTGGGSLFHSHHLEGEGGAGFIVGGSVGRRGMQISAGLAAVSELGGGSFRAVLTRTSDNPLGAAANSTYLGGEFRKWFGGMWSVGYAKRIAGPPPGDNHIFTVGVGLELPVLFRQHPRDTGGTGTASSARAAAPSPPRAP